MKRSPLCFRVLCFSALFSGITPLQAALLVYEGFDGYSAGSNFTGVMPNGNTIGLDTSVSYGGSGAGTFTATATGLTMPGLLSSGGSATSTAASAVVAAKSFA